MFCTQCGKELKDGIKFCTSCGAVVKNVQYSEKESVPKKKGGILVIIVVFLVLLILAASGSAFWLLGGKEMFFDVFGTTTEHIKDSVNNIIDQSDNDNNEESNEESNENESEETINEDIAETDFVESKVVEQDVDTIVITPEAEEITDSQDETANEYILEFSDSKFLTKNDLQNLTAEQCRLARNELYARHGRMFDDEELQAYFDSCSWYVGSISASDFSESMLNDYEIANRDLIVEFEKEMGYR